MSPITKSDFGRFASGARADIAKGVVDYSVTLDGFRINTPLRLCHFMAQVAHESDGFRTTEEYWGPTAAQKRYEGRRDLGNVRRGDGKRFKGHGLIQTTGRHNHRKFTEWVRILHPDAPDFEIKPEELEKFPWAFLSAVWYWDMHGLNALADKNDLRAVTRRINGGYNGLADRKVWFARAWKIWGEGDSIHYAGKGKHPLKSKTNAAAATTALAATAAEVTRQVSIGRSVWDSISDLVTFENPVQSMLIVAVVGLVGFIVWDRMRKAREFEV